MSDKLKVEIGGDRFGVVGTGDPMDGWVTLGIRDNQFDILEQELPFENNSVDEFYWSHTIEHIPALVIAPTLRKMYDKLKPGGKLRTVCPDLYASAVAYVNRQSGEFGGKNAWGSAPPHYQIMGIGGWFVANIVTSHNLERCQENPVFTSSKKKQIGNLSHIMAYDYEMLYNLLSHVGFSKIERTDLTDMEKHRRPGQLCVNSYK